MSGLNEVRRGSILYVVFLVVLLSSVVSMYDCIVADVGPSMFNLGYSNGPIIFHQMVMELS